MRKSARRALAAESLALAAGTFDRRNGNPVLVDRFVDLARTIEPAVETVPGWQELQRRMALGPWLSSCHPLFVLRRIHRRLRSELQWMRWHRQGVF